MSNYDQAAAEAHWYDLPYWLGNFPQVSLNWYDNLHVEGRVLRVAWNDLAGTPPIVAVEILPRTQQMEDRPGGLGNILPAVTALVGIVLPGTSALTQNLVKYGLQAARLGSNVATLFALEEWAKSFKVSPDEFGPQYYPQSFTVPMPLDRAQIMVQRPWYAAAMVYQFAQELQTGQLRTTAKAYADLLQAMLPAGMADPPPYTGGQAPLFRWVEPLGLGAGAGAGGRTSTSALDSPLQSNADQGGRESPALPALIEQGGRGSPALPFLVAAGLLVAGAPIVVVVIVGAAMAGVVTTAKK